jgi:hypothetical protein
MIQLLERAGTVYGDAEFAGRDVVDLAGDRRAVLRCEIKHNLADLKHKLARHRIDPK